MISEAQIDWVRAYAARQFTGASALAYGLIRETRRVMREYDKAVRLYADAVVKCAGLPPPEAGLEFYAGIELEEAEGRVETLVRCFSKLPGFPVD